MVFMYRILSLIMASFIVTGANALNVNDLAPDFNLPDQNNKQHRLIDYRGQWLVLYFYPKDDTPGCTEEACRFRDDILEFRKLNVKLLGISTDSAAKHAQFADKYGLPFPLLADVKATVTKAYDSLINLGIMKFAKRRTFIISPQGKIVKIYTDVDPKLHSGQVIEDFKILLPNY